MPPGITGAAVLPKIYREFGTKRLVFDVAFMTPGIQDQVKEKLAEIKSEGSLYERVEMSTDETHGEYLDRASVNDPELCRKFDESPKDHAKRVFTPRGINSGQYALKVINVLSEIFKQPTLEWEEIKNVPLCELRILIYNVLNFCDSSFATDFSPKRLIDSSQLR